MASRLDNLVKIGDLKREPADRSEFEGLVNGALARLHDAENASLSIESRFDLAYNAAHALCLAALRWHGYRSENRYLVFQTLPDTLAIGDSEVRILDAAHRKRNRYEYEGEAVDKATTEALVRAARVVADKVRKLAPPA